MGRFLWAGKLERLQLDEVKNLKCDGGLNLPCVFSKANALFLSQTCRLLQDPSSKQFGHVKYWIGLHLRGFFPLMGSGPHSELISPYFKNMRLLLGEALLLEDIKVENLKKVTAKALYHGYTSSFPPPKVVFKFDVDWKLVWERLDSPVLDSLARDFLYLIINNIVPSRET